MYINITKKTMGIFACCVCICCTALCAWLFSQRENRAVSGSGISAYTVVIDAGHGGMDGGASGVTGVIEKDINLNISKKIYLMCRLFGIPSAMTREDDISLNYRDDATVRQNKTADLKGRVERVNAADNPLLISIHLNKFQQSKYRGAQTFYSPNHAAGRLLAENIQSNLINRVDKTNTRVAKQGESSIYILKSLTCPAVIVECGFLSNPDEEYLLTQEDYQKKLAFAVFAGYIDFLRGDRA